jgi:hypothetical protein
LALIVEFQQLGFVDRADAQLALDGRNQRRALEERTRERLDGRGELLFAVEVVVHAQNSHVLFTSPLVNQTRVNQQMTRVIPAAT